MSALTPDRLALRTAFLRGVGWGTAERSHLAGDASARSYERLRRGEDRAVLMDAPPGCGDDVWDFLRIGLHLGHLGLSAPSVLAADASQGFLLLEDLGDDLFTQVVVKDPGQEAQLYAAAVDVLLHLQGHPAPSGLPNLSAADWAASAELALDWYARGITGEATGARTFRTALAGALEALADGPRVLILRDYHAGNLIWLPAREGLARVGLLDFQTAQLGQPAYDLVSLLQDARRDVPETVEAEGIARFARGLGTPPETLAPAYAALGALRALRILGIFARLCLVAGKPHYLDHAPRVWAQLQRNLRHPALTRLGTVCRALLPPPSPENLDRLRSLCAASR